MFWNNNRLVICGIIILFLALLNVGENVRTYHLGYQISRMERELKSAHESEKQLTEAICSYKLPRNILAKAESLGMQTKNLTPDAVANLRNLSQEITGLARVNKNAGRIR